MTNLRESIEEIIPPGKVLGVDDVVIDQILKAVKERDSDLIEIINVGIRKLSARWEGKTIEYRKGNKEAFRDIIKFIESKDFLKTIGE
jgi:hypothetical protein